MRNYNKVDNRAYSGVLTNGMVQKELLGKGKKENYCKRYVKKNREEVC